MLDASKGPDILKELSTHSENQALLGVWSWAPKNHDWLFKIYSLDLFIVIRAL